MPQTLLLLIALSVASISNSLAQDDASITCLEAPEAWTGMHLQDIVLNLPQGQTIAIPTRIADEAHEQSAGYQWICPKQAANTAVLFPFSKMIYTAFHMRNVFVPLHILFFDREGKLVDKLWMMPEANSVAKPQYYQPSGEFKYALEITASFTASRLQNAPQISLDLAASGL